MDDPSPDRPVRSTGVHIDIAELEARELELRRRAAELHRFARIAVHDLKQPMNSVETCVTMLTEDLPPEIVARNEEVVGLLLASVRRMKERVGDILDYARLQDQEIDFRSVELGPVVRRCILDLCSEVETSGAEITVNDALPIALGTPSMIGRAVQSIVSNALKFREPDRPCRIAITPTTAPAGMVAIRIEDNGIGIPEEHRKKVFEPFTRLHTETEYPGSGLGLALSERIAAQLGGEISISDGMQNGTAVTLTLKAG